MITLCKITLPCSVSLFVSEEFEEKSVEFLFKIRINPLRLIQGVPSEEVYLAPSTASAFLGGLLLVFHRLRQGFASACCCQSLVYTSQVAATSNMTPVAPSVPRPTCSITARPRQMALLTLTSQQLSNVSLLTLCRAEPGDECPLLFAAHF